MSAIYGSPGEGWNLDVVLMNVNTREDYEKYVKSGGKHEQHIYPQVYKTL